jgi:hypothetical protein
MICEFQNGIPPQTDQIKKISDLAKAGMINLETVPFYITRKVNGILVNFTRWQIEISICKDGDQFGDKKYLSSMQKT